MDRTSGRRSEALGCAAHRPHAARRTDRPTLEEFLERARGFLDARYPKKKVDEVRRAFVWEEGTDRVSVFEEPDPALEHQRVQQVRAWRREPFDHGFAWIDEPVEYGGAASCVPTSVRSTPSCAATTSSATRC